MTMTLRENVNIIQGMSDHTKIKRKVRPRMGFPEKPIAELIKLWYMIFSPGQKARVINTSFSKISLNHYEKLCSLDCLGIEERHNDSNHVYEEH